MLDSPGRGENIPHNSVPHTDAFTCIWGTLKVIIVPGWVAKIDRDKKKCSHSEQSVSTRERLTSPTWARPGNKHY